MNPLAVVPIEALASGSDRFACRPLRATMRADVCEARQRKAAAGDYVDGTERASYRHCERCPIGTLVAARINAHKPPEAA